MALVDVDDMRAINDSYGHAVGDVVLRRLTELMRDATGANDLAARVGGEEFLLAWPGDDATDAAHEADDLRARFHELDVGLGNGVQVGGFTLSAGIADVASLRHARDGNIAESLLGAAEDALSAAKRDGGDQVRVFPTS